MGPWAKQVPRAHCTAYTCSPRTMRKKQEDCGVMENVGCYVKIFCLEQPQKQARQKQISSKWRIPKPLITKISETPTGCSMETSQNGWGESSLKGCPKSTPHPVWDLQDRPARGVWFLMERVAMDNVLLSSSLYISCCLPRTTLGGTSDTWASLEQLLHCDCLHVSSTWKHTDPIVSVSDTFIDLAKQKLKWMNT